MVTLKEAKEYLKVDTDTDDELINKLLKSAKRIVWDVGRIGELEDISERPKVRLSILHTLEYLYDTRGNTDFNKLMLELRSLLDGIRTYRF